jgi:transposase
VFLCHVARAYPDQELHLIMDNYATHKHPNVKTWLAANQRIHVHFTTTSGSWLNLVEVWFSIIEKQAIHRGTFRSVRELMIKVRAFIRLERPLPTLRLDQNRRPDPAESQPSNNFSFGPLGVKRHEQAEATRNCGSTGQPQACPTTHAQLRARPQPLIPSSHAHCDESLLTGRVGHAGAGRTVIVSRSPEDDVWSLPEREPGRSELPRCRET